MKRVAEPVQGVAKPVKDVAKPILQAFSSNFQLIYLARYISIH